ncbi:MAG: FtsX-like permease family protein [Candidatus Dormiibacterota bacterium]
MTSGGLWRMIGRQVRSRRDRSIALGAGILVASVSFSLLTAAASTSQLEVHGTIDAAARPAYDILVRPKGAADAIETQDNLVRDNFLAGTFGGISIAQWQKILALPNVTVAAPIANIGYVIPQATVVVPVVPLSSSDPYQLFRVQVTWKAANGLSSYPGGTDYVYYTPTDRLVIVQQADSSVAVEEVVTGHAKPVASCPELQLNPPGGLNTGGEENLACFSGMSPTINTSSLLGTPSAPGAIVTFSFPMMLSAIDPVQEANLVGLPQTVVSGTYLSELQGLLPPVQQTLGLPVIAASRNFLDESLTASVQQLTVPPDVNVPDELANSQAVQSFLQGLAGPVVQQRTLSAQSSYATLLNQLRSGEVSVEGQFQGGMIITYWTSSGVAYRAQRSALAPIATSNPASVWDEGAGTFETEMPAPPGNEDTQFQRLTGHQGNLIYNEDPTNGSFGVVQLKIQGEFDPDKLPGFNPLSAVPLETYYPPVVTGANAASEKALDNQPLGPTMNLGGYVAQPPMLLTTITALKQMLSRTCYLSGNLAITAPSCTRYSDTDAPAPISAIRVRVADVHGFEPIDRARILAVATAIKKATGLQVDITAGSSPTTVDVDLPAGCCGEPALTVAEGWVRKGAALAVLNAVDAKSLVLFVLVLVVCVLFLANGAYASVRSRRTELGVLACLGWGRAALFRLVLGELALVGLTTGVVGAALAEILALALRLDLPWWRALLVVPIALGLACVAGIAPAYAATRGRPLDAVYSVPGGGGRHRAVRHVSGIARANLLRRPARLVSGALGLFIGVAAFAVLLAVQLAFQGQVVGTALGNVVSVQVRSVDLIAAVLALLLGAFSVADVLAVNLRDRAGEQAVLAATGWRPATLFRLAFTEGMVVGIVGAIAGGAVGLGLAAILTGSALAVAPSAILAAVIGLVLVGAVLMVPAWQASQTAPAAALAED